MKLPNTYHFRGREYTPTYTLINNLEDRDSLNRHLSHFEELLKEKDPIAVVRMVATYDHEVHVNLRYAIEHATRFFERITALHSTQIYECIVRVIRKEERDHYERYVDALLFINPSLLEDASRTYSQWSLEWKDVTGWINNEVVVQPLATLGTISGDESLDVEFAKGKNRKSEEPLQRVIREIEYLCRSTKGGVFLETHIWPLG